MLKKTIYIKETLEDGTIIGFIGDIDFLDDNNVKE